MQGKETWRGGIFFRVPLHETLKRENGKDMVWEKISQSPLTGDSGKRVATEEFSYNLPLKVFKKYYFLNTCHFKLSIQRYGLNNSVDAVYREDSLCMQLSTCVFQKLLALKEE
jgi:hypothetical protein